VLRPASASAVHRHMLIGRSSQSQPAPPEPRRHGSAHLSLPRLARIRPTVTSAAHRPAANCPAATYTAACPRYSVRLPVPSGPGSRSARANARRRCAFSKHPWLRCR
jgi:hypothetical protein